MSNLIGNLNKPFPFRVGQRVYFGRRNGERTLAEIVKINRKMIKVKTLETRGNGHGAAAGTIWNVAAPLLTLATGEAATKPISMPQGSIKMPTRNSPFENPFTPVETLDIVKEARAILRKNDQAKALAKLSPVDIEAIEIVKLSLGKLSLAEKYAILDLPDFGGLER